MNKFYILIFILLGSILRMSSQTKATITEKEIKHAESLFTEEKYDSLISYADSFERLPYEVLFMVSKSHEELGNYPASIKIAKQLLKLDSLQAEGYSLLSGLYYSTGDYTLGNNILTKGFELTKNIGLGDKLSHMQYEVKEYAQAIQTLDKCIGIIPLSKFSLLKASCYQKMDKNNKSFRILDSLYKKDSHNYVVVRNLCEAYEKKNGENDPDSILAITAKYLEFDNDNVEILLMRARSLFNTGKHKEAYNIYKKLVTSGKEIQGANNLFYAGISFYKNDDCENAVKILKDADEIYAGQNYFIKYFLMMSYVKEEDWKNATDEGMEALKLILPKPERLSDVYYQLGYNYFETQSFDNAKVMLRYALSYDEGMSKARILLAEILEKEKDYPTALFEYLKITEKESNSTMENDPDGYKMLIKAGEKVRVMKAQGIKPYDSKQN